MPRRKFIVSIDMPNEMELSDASRYIADAVQTMGGSMHPDSFESAIGDNDVTVMTTNGIAVITVKGRLR